jgi:hypothetical protein
VTDREALALGVPMDFTSEDELDNIDLLMVAERDIGIATAIHMTRCGVGPEEAVAVLAAVSQRTGQSLVDVARQYIRGEADG